MPTNHLDRIGGTASKHCASRAPQCRAKCKAAAAINQSLDLFVSQDYESCMNDEESAQRMPRRAAWVRPPLPLSPRDDSAI